MAWTLFTALLAAHLLADFVLQSNADVARKERPAVFLKHLAVLTAITYAMIGDAGRWDIAVLAGLSHALVDYLKMLGTSRRSALAFGLDQLAHLAVLGGLAVLATESASVRSLWVELLGARYTGLLVVTSGAVACVWAGGVVVGFVIAPFRDRMERTLRRGFDRGGRTIGRLERGLIFVLVLSGSLSAVGFLVAAKSIFRFGDLRGHPERATAEYILIGTLASFLWALATSLATRAAL